MAAEDELDDLDREILERLRGNARASFRSIAKALGRSTPAVAERVRRMESSGLIEAYTATVAEGVDESPKPPHTRGVCAECKDPVYGRSVARTLRGTRHRFCCSVCEERFVARYHRTLRGVQGGGSALILFGWVASFTTFGAACFGSMGGCGPGGSMPPTSWDRCPPWVPRRAEDGTTLGASQVRRLYRAGWRVTSFSGAPEEPDGLLHARSALAPPTQTSSSG